MKKLQLLLLLLVVSLLGFGQSRDIASTGGVQQRFLAPGNQRVLADAATTVVWDNGPLVNSPGTGFGGADESVLQNSSLVMSILGFGIQTSLGNLMADDFVLT